MPRLVLVAVSSWVLLLGAARAEAAPITWHWAGPVTGYAGQSCNPGFNCPTLDRVVPLGTTVDVIVSLDPDLPPPNSRTPCNRGTASASLQLLGRTYTNTGVVWDEGYGFGPGLCVPGYDEIEIVVPSWGSGGPALPDGWVPFSSFGDFFPGLWWSGDLTHIQPTSIYSQFPFFWIPDRAPRQTFIANLQAVPADLQPVPEPTTWLLLSTGLAAGAANKYRRSKAVRKRG